MNKRNDSHHFYIVFGAAVKPGGVPSGTLTRRVNGAWHLGGNNENSYYVVSGAVGRYGPAEAQVMQELLLEAGVNKANILLELQGHDTMESAYYCQKILAKHSHTQDTITVCSSPYHNLRCQILLSFFGVKSKRGKMPSDRAALGVRKWLFYYFRESIAIPWDILHLLFLKLFKQQFKDE